MNTNDKLIRMYKAVNGKLQPGFTLEIVNGEYDEVLGINLLKDGSLCLFQSTLSILMDYITKDFCN